MKFNLLVIKNSNVHLYPIMKKNLNIKKCQILQLRQPVKLKFVFHKA